MNPETTPPLDVLMAASLYLMTRYAEEKRPETAVALAQHLHWISEHPECGRSILAKAAARLSQQWHRLARRTSLHREFVKEPSRAKGGRVSPERRNRSVY